MNEKKIINKKMTQYYFRGIKRKIILVKENDAAAKMFQSDYVPSSQKYKKEKQLFFKKILEPSIPLKENFEFEQIKDNLIHYKDYFQKCLIEEIKYESSKNTKKKIFFND